MTAHLTRWLDAVLHRGPGYEPPPSETDLRAALTTLADQWEDQAATHDARATDAPLGTVRAFHAAKCRTYLTTADTLRYALRSGRIQPDLMPDAERDHRGDGSAS